MARLLTRDDLPFETRCYVCDPANAGGLRIACYLDEAAGRVIADYTPEEAHEGAPGVIHGGVLAALLDDAMAWAVNLLSGSFGLTVRAEFEYRRMVRSGERYAVAAWIADTDGEAARATTAAELRDGEGRLCCAATAEFALMPMAEAERILAGATASD